MAKEQRAPWASMAYPTRGRGQRHICCKCKNHCFTVVRVTGGDPNLTRKMCPACLKEAVERWLSFSAAEKREARRGKKHDKSIS